MNLPSFEQPLETTINLGIKILEQTSSTQRILVIGAGRGGTAMLELFINDPQMNIVGIIDVNPNAPALAIASKHHIPCFTDIAAAIEACKPCLAFNLSADESATAFAEDQLGRENVMGGFQARFLWKVITKLKQTNEQFEHLAHHDSLTLLPNRILFYDRLGQAIAKAKRENELVATMYLDLDGFKQVNDTLGHNAGDILLQEVAKRISACVRDSDTVARMGGDEFTVILCNIRVPRNIELVAEKIIETIASPFLINGKNCMISASIGISIYPENGKTPDQLVTLADAAMYTAKNGGKNCYRISGK